MCGELNTAACETQALRLWRHAAKQRNADAALKVGDYAFYGKGDYAPGSEAGSGSGSGSDGGDGGDRGGAAGGGRSGGGDGGGGGGEGKTPPWVPLDTTGSGKSASTPLKVRTRDHLYASTHLSTHLARTM